MRTLSVKETAQALGISVRTVQYRLQNGELKGMRTTNQYGVKEWRVWPNKEIVERLGPGKVSEDLDLEQPSQEFLGGDSSAVVDAESIEQANDGFDSSEIPIKVLVRELTQQFAEQLSREKQVILQLQRDLENKDLQLRLLPDLEKQAEDRRKEAELKELEAEALRKQIAAMQDEQRNKSQEIERLNNEIVPQLQRQLDQERVKKEQELAETQGQLGVLEQEKRKAEEASRKAEELSYEMDGIKVKNEAETKAIQEQVKALHERLERSLVPEMRQQIEAELKQKDQELVTLKVQLAGLEAERRKAEALEIRVGELQQSKLEVEQSLQAEIDRLRQEKDTHAQAVQDQLGMLTTKLERMARPWWQKLFSTGDE